MHEIERYELSAGPAYRFELDRRDFLATLGGGLLILLATDTSAFGQESGRGFGNEKLPQEIDAWLHIGPDGRITGYTGKCEVGQNARTNLTQAIADELHVPMESVVLVMADTDLTPYDMGTFGSRTTPTMVPQLRKAAAAAREMLMAMASEKWGVPASSLTVNAGRISKMSGESIGFGELTGGKQLVKTINGATPTPPEHWTIAGTSAPKVNASDIVTGRHRYTADLKRPGMLYGRIVRPPAFGAKLVSVDTTGAAKMAGVTAVHEGDFIGVAAPKQETADWAATAVKAEWKEHQQPSDKELFEYLKAHAEPEATGPSAGSIDQGMAAADLKLHSTYTVPYIAHIPLEPRTAVAEWNNGKLTVWTGTQRPFGVRSELAQAFQIPENRVRVIVPDTGSGYGGKHTGECAIEAARLAKAAGKPVKVLWTREEEFTWAYFRPAGVIEIASGITKNGKLTAWEFHNYNSGPSGIDTPYHAPNKRIRFHASESPLRQGSYRGLAATANHFARECHMDELACGVGLDPLEFRLRNLEDPRLRAVLEAAAEKFGWKALRAGPGHGYGIAAGVEKGGYVACCCEITLEGPSQNVRIHRVVTAFDCGAVVNPEHLKNQVEGAVMMGIGGALFEAVQFSNGRIENATLSQYRVPRFSDMPVLETVLVDHKDVPSAGAGETPIVGIAPAVGNAIYQATGQRLRSLPMAPNGVGKKS